MRFGNILLLFFVLVSFFALSVVAPVCGDSILDTGNGEQCDDANPVNTDQCNSSCYKTYCGDTIVQSPNGNVQTETCDDGNIIDNDGCSSVCQAEPVLACFDVWEKKFGGVGQNEIGYSVIQTYDKKTSPRTPTGYVIAGSNQILGANGQFWLVKTGTDGTTCNATGESVCSSGGNFVSLFGGNGFDEARSVIQYFIDLTDRHVFVAVGTFYNTPTDTNISVVRTNSSGLVIPNDTVDFSYIKTFGGNGIEKGLSISSNGVHFLITGFSTSWTSGIASLWALKMGNSPAVLCTYFSTGECNGSPSTFAKLYGPVGQTTEGHGIVSDHVFVGNSNSFPAPADVWLIKTNSIGDSCSDTSVCFNGATQFLNIFTGSMPTSDIGWSIAKTSDDGYILAGATSSFTGTVGSAVWLIKVNSLGQTCTPDGTGNCNTNNSSQFVRKFDGSGSDIAYSVVQAFDGGYLIVGSTDTAALQQSGAVAGSKNFLAIKTNQYGDTCNANALSGPCFNGYSQFVNSFGGANNDEAYSVYKTVDSAQKPTGYILTGYTEPAAGDKDLWLLKIDDFGNGPNGYGFINPAFTGYCGPPCGNNITETNAPLLEECDDGKTGGSLDKCTDLCKLTTCGDTIIQSLDGTGIVEECDNGRFCSDYRPCTTNAQCAGIGDGLCKARSSVFCSFFCKEKFSGFKIQEVVFETPTKDNNSSVLRVGENLKVFSVVIKSTETGQVDINVTVRDSEEKLISSLVSPVSAPLAVGTQTINLLANIDFSSSPGNQGFSTLPLVPGKSYKVIVDANTFVGAPLRDSKTVFFTVPSTKRVEPNKLPVPETNLLLVPLVVVAVLSLVLRKK